MGVSPIGGVRIEAASALKEVAMSAFGGKVDIRWRAL
jgi:hypothetical protein